ncbi:hypothetical protein [Parasitella parasitica]|uniref:Uncharacterized protein n=1 Tax=Parasitella parasitica TaxID=35722 RepID=A0A0B7N273_9FUNG|nr:hypothetical protein [Parasitella parasitica]
MNDWKLAQQQHWQNDASENTSEYTTDEEYTDDDDLPPVAAAWGTQTIEKDGTTNVSLTVSGWQSLIDPSVKTKAGGIGSGQLHRAGTNFKPIDEQDIIDRRLGKPVKGGLGGGKKKKKLKKKPTANGAVNMPPAQKTRPLSTSLIPPSSSANRGREAITSGPWGSGSLSSTPFWQQSANSASSGIMASRYASLPSTNSRPPITTPTQARAPAPGPTYPSQQQFQPQQPAIPVAPSRPVQPAEPTPFSGTLHGSAASKWAPAAATIPVAKPVQHQPPPQPQPQMALNVPTASFKLEPPIMNIQVEILQGHEVNISVYANEIPEKAVERLERSAGLTIPNFVFDEYQRKNVKKYITSLVEDYNKRMGITT